MTVPEHVGKVATSAIDAFRAQPGLLFLTIVNVAFLAFVYFIGTLVLVAYDEQQRQIHERYSQALRVVDRCINVALDHVPPRRPHTPSTDEMRGGK
jgi:hypothetical protein